MTDRLQMNLVFNVAAFSILRTKKFPARWQVIKKRSRFDLRAWSFTAVPHNVDFAAVNNNFCPCDRARFTCTHAESRHAGDTRQGFAAKPQRRDRLQVGSRTNFACRMSLERKQRVIAVHAAAIVDHADQPNSAATNGDVDVSSAGVETVFNQFLYDRRRAFYPFAGRHLAGDGLRKQSDPAHLVSSIVNSRFPIAKKINDRERRGVSAEERRLGKPSLLERVGPLLGFLT